MNKKNIIIIGGGGQAKVIISILQKIDEYNIIGYTDIKDNGPVLNCHYIGTDEKMLNETDNRKKYYAVLGVGCITINKKREDLFEKYIKHGITFPPIISPDAVVNEDVSIGEGTVIFQKVVINSGTKIGICSIINTGAIIEHDCIIGDFVHISPGSILSGGVKLGKHVFAGAGSVFKQYIEICDECIIGAGSTVINNISNPGVYVGTPSKKIK